MGKHLYFVRHGESNSNADGISRGRDSALTERGHGEAAMVAERIARIGVDAVVASSYKRTIETATPIHTKLDLPLETSDLLIEFRRPSAFYGRSRHDADIHEQNTLLFSSFGVPGYQHSDEETFAEFKQRSLDAIAMLEAHPAERICVVTHAIFLRALFCALYIGQGYDGEDFKRAWHLKASNTGISYARWDEGDGPWNRGWSIVSWNDLAHLG